MVISNDKKGVSLAALFCQEKIDLIPTGFSLPTGQCLL
jgi:hypothetical protein